MCLNCSVIGWYARLDVVHSLSLSLTGLVFLLFRFVYPTSLSFHPSIQLVQDFRDILELELSGLVD